MKNQWEVWTSALSPEYCKMITTRAKKYIGKDATIGFDSNNHLNNNYRSSTIRWLDPLDSDSDIAETIMRFVKSSNRNNFGFDINWLNEIQHTEYYAANNGQYGWHHDVFWENEMPYDRKLSIVVQLSNPNDYDGGEFEFSSAPSPTKEQWSPQGSILIFPSFFLHRVKPVTRGTRVSLVSWIDGPKWR